MADIEDSTEIFTMRKDLLNFADFSDHKKNRLRPMGTLNFDESIFVPEPKASFSTSNISVGSMIDKNIECKAMESKLIEANTQISRLRSQISTSEVSRKRQRIEMEEELEDTKQKGVIRLDVIEDQRQELRRLQRNETERKTQMDDMRQELSSLKATFTTKVSTLQREKIELEAQMDEYSTKSRAQIMDMKKDKMWQQAEFDICHSELKEAQEQLAAAQKRLADMRKQMQEMEEYKLQALNSSFKVKDLESTVSRMQDDAVVTQAMKTQIDRLAQLETENRKLKDENDYLKNTQENMHLLQEKLHSATQKLALAESRGSLVVKVQEQCEDLQGRLQKWESCSLTGSNRPSSPMQVRRQMENLQKNNLLSLEKQGELQGSVRTLEQSFTHSQAEVSKTNMALEHERHKGVQNADFIKKIQRKLLLLKKERDSYRSIVDSYDQESKRTKPQGAASIATANRVRQLEESVKMYSNHSANLETQMEQVTAKAVASGTKIINLQAELVNRLPLQMSATTSELDRQIIVNLRLQVQDSLADLERVTEGRDVLAARIEQRHLQGDYDPVKTKVIHMIENPASVAQVARAAEVGKLNETNALLSERLRLLEEGGPGVEDLTVRVQENLSQPSNTQEMEELRGSLASSELKYKRLTEAFKNKTQEFREVVFQLLGYRIDIPTDCQYRLMNIFSEAPEESLVFQKSESGVMELLATEYSATLSEKVETYLQHADSIPAFLAAITLQLFNRQTLVQSETSFMIT